MIENKMQNTLQDKKRWRKKHI